MTKKLENRRLLEDRLASLSRLSAGIAHEINNPLGLILGYTQLMLKEAEPGDQFHEDLKIVEKHAKNCKKIVEELLKFSRATETDKTPANLNNLVKEALSAVQPRLKAKKVFIIRKLDPALPLVNMDPHKIKQVFMNILINAEQAMDDAGAISVTTRHDATSQRALVLFRDRGAGIATEIIHKIFDPFFTTRPTGMGTGLGLAVSYGIIRDHDGEITVKSAPGKGSTFTVWLPLGHPGASPEQGGGCHVA